MITTRKELFDQVWSSPMTKVAIDYGVTSTALKKTCTRHEIPTPERGYWAKLQHGKPVAGKPELASASSSHLDTVEIVGVVAPTLPAAVMEAQVAARARLGEHGNSGETQDLIEPPILTSTRRALAKAQPDQLGFVSIEGKGLASLKVAPASVERGLDFLSRLFTAAHAQGFSLQGGDEGIALIVDGERISFAVEEQSQKSPHVQTAEDRRQLAESQRWGWPDPRLRKYDHIPSGRLALLITVNPYGGLRRKFADGRSQEVEAMIPEILVNMVAHAALIKDNRRKAEEDQRRQVEAETRRRFQEAFASREKERETFVDAIHSQLVERAKLVAVLTHLDALALEKPDQLAEMASWVRRRLSMIDTLISAHALDLTARAAQVEFLEPLDLEGQGRVKYFSRFQTLRLWSSSNQESVATSQTAYEWTRADSDAESNRLDPKTGNN